MPWPMSDISPKTVPGSIVAITSFLPSGVMR